MKNEDQPDQLPNEQQDIRPKPALAGAFAILIFFVGLIAVSGWYFGKDFTEQAKRYEKYSLPSEKVGPRPGAWTTKDLENYKLREEAAINSYAWTDASEKFATIPLDRAIDLAIERNIFKLPPGGPDAR